MNMKKFGLTVFAATIVSASAAQNVPAKFPAGKMLAFYRQHMPVEKVDSAKQKRQADSLLTAKLFLEVAVGDTAKVKKLLEAGADVNARDAKGRPPLFHAAWFEDKAMVRFLMDNGADLKAIDYLENDALAYAGNKEIKCIIELKMLKDAHRAK